MTGRGETGTNGTEKVQVGTHHRSASPAELARLLLAAGRHGLDLGGPNGGGDAFLVADLGATHLRIASASAGTVRPIAVHRTADLPWHPTDGIAPSVVTKMVDAWTRSDGGRSDAPAGVGIGVAAYVTRDGSVLQRRPFGIMAGSMLRDGAMSAFDCPVVVDNDANLAALGEQHIGAGRGCDDFLLLTLGTNIGLGIVNDGRILRGAHGAAGEAGFLLIPARRGRAGTDEMGRAGRLGNGRTAAPAGYAWLEDLVGGGALARSLGLPGTKSPLRAKRTDGPTPGDLPAHTAESEGQSPSDQRVFVRAAAGDRRALTVARHAVEGWAALIADLVALFDPERIILSGGLVEDIRPFIEPLRRRAAELSPLPPDIRIGELGALAGLVGAAEAVRIAAFAAVGVNHTPALEAAGQRSATMRR